MKNKLVVFDIDGCMLNTPEPEEGKLMYEETFGIKYPHVGWWGRPESLSPEFDIKPNEAVHELYRKAMLDGSHIIMMTNRLKKLGDLLTMHLRRHGIIFEHKSYGDTMNGKQTKPIRVGSFLDVLTSDGHVIDELVVIDDMDEQIDHYIVMREAFIQRGLSMKVLILQILKDGTIVER